MKILFYPEPDGQNAYTSNMVENIEAVAGEGVSFSPNIKDIVLRPHKTLCYKKYDVVVINWLENNLRSERNRLFLFGVLKFYVYILYFKLAARKTIYIRHNFYPHDMPQKQAWLAKKIVDFTQQLLDRKVAHSGHLRHEGYQYISHPLYERDRGPATAQQSDEPAYFLIFGRIERYKQIHSIIDHWPDKERLLIVGPASDEAYVKELMASAEGRNIEFDIRFVPNEEVDAIMSNAKAIILSHAGDEMIVSGSFFHAISYGVPVIASRQPFLNWLKRDIGFSGLKLYGKLQEFEMVLNEPGNVNKEMILSESASLFGEQIVQHQWRSLLNELGH